jgi:glycosyltransferase involved in cell wall biosynthesis
LAEPGRPPVALVITGLAFGGAERELVQVAAELVRRGWPVEVVSLLPLDGFAEELVAAGVPVRSLGMRRGRPSLGAFLRFLRFLDERRPAVLHGFLVHANLLCRLARRFVPVPVVISTAQNTHEGGPLRDWLYRATDSLTDWTTQVSEAGRARYAAAGLARPETLLCLPNSVDPARFRPDPEARAAVRAELGVGEELVWLAVGRLEPQKDYPNLLAAFARLPATAGRLWIAGRGGAQAELEERAAALGLGERVRFLGLRRDVPRVLAAADAFVMASAWEGTPLALLEAAATGLPAVVTAVGGNAEVLAGLPQGLVPPRDAAALAEALAALAALPAEARRALGHGLRASVLARYGLAANVDRWEQLYLRALAARWA